MDQEAKRLASEDDDTTRASKKIKRDEEEGEEEEDTPMSGWEIEGSSREHQQHNALSDGVNRSTPGGFDQQRFAGSAYPNTTEDDIVNSSDGFLSSSDTSPFTQTLVTKNDRYPRLNWSYLFKHRKLLEDNWKLNRYTTFMIPHPDHKSEGHRDSIYTLQYSPKYLVSGSKDRTIRIWNLKTRRLLQEPLQGHSGSVLCLQFDESEDQDVIISGSSDASVIIWSFSTGKILNRIVNAHSESVLNLKFTKDYLVTCSKDRTIKVWNRRRIMPNDPDYPIGSKVLFPRRTRGFEPERRIIEPYTCIQILRGHVAAVNAIQIHGDEVASGSGDRILKIWNIKTGECAMSLIGHQKGIACVQYDGKTVVSGSSDMTVRVFNRRTGAETAQLMGHGDLVRTVQSSAHGNGSGPGKIVSGSYDETIRIWRKVGDIWEPGQTLVFGRGLREARDRERRPSPSQQCLLTEHGIPSVETQNQMLATLSAARNRALNPGPQQPNQAILNPIQPLEPTATASSSTTPASALEHAQNSQINPSMAEMAAEYNAAVAAAATAPVPAPVTAPPPGRACRVFKLQFDPRMIICCSQDSRIVGWDFANLEPNLEEASQFFK